MNGIIKMDKEEEFEERARKFLERTGDFALRRALTATSRSWVDIAHALHPFTSVHLTETEEAVLAEADGNLMKVDPQLRERVENAKEAVALKLLYEEIHHAD